MNTNLNNYLKNIMPTTQTVTTMDFGPFVSDYSCGCKSDETKTNRMGWKRRMVLEALKGMEMMSVRKMHEALKEKGIEVSVMTVANAIQSLKGDVNNRNSFRTCTKSNAQSNYNYRDNNIVRSHTEIVQSGKNVRKDYKVLEGLSKGITISEIAAETGVNEKTIRRYIKKAKDSGIIRNEGTRKNPKWILASEQDSFRTCAKTTESFQNPNDNIQPESLDTLIKEKETTEEIKEKNIKDMNDYNFDDNLNDVIPGSQAATDRVIKSLKSIDEYLYYTGEGKDKFDEWFDFSLANS